MSAGREVRYADSGAYQIAYEVLGDGPIDILVAFDWGTNIDLIHENPLMDQFLTRLASIGRVINFDPRGAGLSDPLERLPTLEEWAEDVQAVLRAAASGRATLIGHGMSAQFALLFAAMYPNQTSEVVTINGYARLRSAPDYRWGYTPEWEPLLDEIYGADFGTGAALQLINPSWKQTPKLQAWSARVERAVGTPRQALRRQHFAFDIDVRSVLPAIEAPVLVVQSEHDQYVNAGHGKYLAEHIPHARLALVPGRDHAAIGSPEELEAIVGEIEEFLTGRTQRPATHRSLMTVAITDMVDSTVKAAALGDQKWRSMLELHESLARREVDDADGRLVKFTGDGLLATFDGPARAVQCMKSLVEALEPIGLPIRAGVHTGEVETIGDDIGGLGVHIAARISAMAAAGEILTSSTVRDLVAGSGLEFDDRGEHELKGVPGMWRVLAAT